MALEWMQMNVMEPDWFEAQTPAGPVQLHMTWAEDEWLLCRVDDVIFHTGTADKTEAKTAAERWLAENE